MFDNIGGKIKTLASVICIIGIIGCCIIGIVLMTKGELLVIIGLAVMVLGSLLSWVGSFVLYGFGQLIENSDKLVSEKTSHNPQSRYIFSDTLKFENKNQAKNGKCELCDAEDGEVFDCKIVDDMGTRYRTICADCAKKHNATPV